MRAVNYYIIVDKIKEKPTSKSGFVMTELQNADIRYLKGKVISAGDQVVGVEEGDIVWYNKNSGHSIEFDDKLFYVIKNGDVVIVE